MVKRLLTFSLSLLFVGVLMAQKQKEFERCATNRIHEERSKKLGLESTEQFERWLQEKIKQGSLPTQLNGKQRVVITIPYVIHIIHNGEPVGTGTNIPQAWIDAQMLAANNDFRKLNADISILPTVFSGLASDFEIEFCPASVDPSGNTLLVPGVNRIDRNALSFTAPPYNDTYFDSTVKPATVWNTDNYFNIWVASMSGGLLGYAQFPASTLPGMPTGGTANTDGVVIQYDSFGDGNVGLNAPYNKGRTFTHEAGHWLGLRHIWGDATCGNDFCTDTPTQNGPNFGCPTFPSLTCTNNGDMSYNYMDYTDDACMVMFTPDQKTRAVFVMANSPRRLSLLSSQVCTLPGINVAVTDVSAPCSKSANATVSVTIKNKGADTIQIGAVSLSLTTLGGVVASYPAVTNSIKLPSNATQVLTFTNVNLNSTNQIDLTADAILANDANLTDNTLGKLLNYAPPSISSTVASVCSGDNFTMTVLNPRQGATAIEWQSSVNNTNFNTITGTNVALTTAIITPTFFRYIVSCGAVNDTSNVVYMSISTPNNCYCAPTYSSGCGLGDEIKNVTMGALNNSSLCTASPYYTFYTGVAIPTLVKSVSENFSIGFGSDPNQYYAIWIDENNDGQFAVSEMKAKNTVAIGANGTATGTVTVPFLDDFIGPTRMRIRGGNDSGLQDTQSCGASSSSYGETEDYIVNIEYPAVNVTMKNIQFPCRKTASGQVGVLIKNRSMSPILPGSVSVNLAWTGGVTGTATVSNTTTLQTNDTELVLFNNLNLNTNANISFTATAVLIGDMHSADDVTTQSVNLGTPTITPSVATTCPNVPFSLSLANTNPNQTNYIWQSSPNNTAFTTMTGFSGSSITLTQATSQFYRVIVTCSGQNDTSSVLSVPSNFLNCYCVPSYTNGCGSAGGDAITRVAFSTVNNTTGCAASPYFTYYNTLAVPNLTRGTAYNITITFGGDPNQYFMLWVDHDGDGAFSASEKLLGNTTAIAGNGSFIGSFTIPNVGNFAGQTRLRIRGGDDFALNDTQFCGASNSTWGETEDYLINIMSNCTTPSLGTPTANATSASVSIGCVGCNPPYVLEYGPVGFVPGTGATAGAGGAILNTNVLINTISGLQEGTSYDVYARRVCGTFYSANSVKRTFTTTCSDGLPYIDGFNRTGLSNCWSATVVTSGVVAPAITNLTAGTNPMATPAEGTHMLRFNSASASAGAKMRLTSKPLNTTGYSSIDVSFQMFENAAALTANDKVTLQYSINGGTTWTDVEDNVRANPTQTLGRWYNRAFTLPPDAGDKAALRVALLFTSATGNNIYVDDFRVYQSPAFPNFNDNVCQAITLNNVSGYNKFRFINGSSTVAELYPNGVDLGTVTVNVKENLAGSSNVPPAPLNGQFCMPRYFNINSSTASPLPQSVKLRMFFHNEELDDFNTQIGGAEDAYTVLVKTYRSAINPLTHNCVATDNFTASVNLPVSNILTFMEGFALEVQPTELAEFGVFPSVDPTPIVPAKVYLSFADPATGLMLPLAPSLTNFPLSDPYSTTQFSTAFTHVNSGSAAATSSTVMAVTGNNAIVDWVFMELRTGPSGLTTVVNTRAALLQADGDVVDTDGVSPVAFPNASAGNYYVAIRHRNHLGARTLNPIAVSNATPLVNFTNDPNFLNGVTPVIAISATKYTLNGGDGNMDGSADGTDSTVWEAQNGSFLDYLFNADYNFDGSVDGTDATIWEGNNGKYQEID
jgi:hypothetical protein